MRIPKSALLALLIIGYVVWVLSLAATLRAETARYEYRATPEGEPKPLLIPCFVLDRFNFLCIETGEIFVDVAGARSHSRLRPAAISPPGLFPDISAAATPSIILAQQKLASDGWVLTAQDRDAYQQWIHDNRPSCCDHRDCAPATVEWTPRGWKVAGADNLVPERDTISWPFPTPYACIINRYVRCLFLSSGG